VLTGFTLIIERVSRILISLQSAVVESSILRVYIFGGGVEVGVAVSVGVLDG